MSGSHGTRWHDHSVLRYLARRVGQAVAIVFLVVSLTFLFIHLAPGDPFPIVGTNAVTREISDANRQKFGLDQPLGLQYAKFMVNMLTGDFGVSYQQQRPVWTILWEKIPATALLGASALIISFGLGIAIGAFQGLRALSRWDRVLSFLTLAVFSVPVFWFAYVVLDLFAVRLGFPTGGMTTPIVYDTLSPIGKFFDRAKHLLLPAVTLGLVGVPRIARFQRAAMIDVADKAFLRTAQAKGLHPRTITLHHAVRNALLPTITLFGLSLPILFSGALFVENVFSWPGLGREAVDAIVRRDYPVVTGAALLVAVLVVTGNLFADLLYRLVDPRTRTNQ